MSYHNRTVRLEECVNLVNVYTGSQKFEEASIYDKAVVLTLNKQWPVEVKTHIPQGEKLTVPSFTMPQVVPGSSTPSASSNSSCSTVRKAFELKIQLYVIYKLQCK